jgi:nucleoside-diphosphate-sugar epimerase
MRIFLAGASGVIGVRLVPLLVKAGHTVAGMTRSQAELVERLGAQPVVCDVYDAAALHDAMRRFDPKLVLHQLTDLPDDVEQLGSARPANVRMRTEGTRNLLAAADGAKMIAQSTAFPAGAREDLERDVLGAGGVVLRYGYFYGPGTWHAEAATTPPPRIHIDHAAQATVDALDAPPGTVLELVEP